MLDDLPVAVTIIDDQGQQVHANRTFWELFAVPVSRRAESSLPLLLHPEEEFGDEVFGELTSGSADKVRVFREFVRPDGSGFRGQLTVVSLELGTGQPWFLCVVDDMSERVSASDELGRLARVVESTSDLVGVLDLSGRVIYLNHAARAFFAVSEAETAASTDLYTPDSIVKFATEIRPVIEEGRTWAGELTMVRSDGAVVSVLQSIAPDESSHDVLRLSVVGRPVDHVESGPGSQLERAGVDDELVVGLAAQLAPVQQRVNAVASEIEANLPGTAGSIREAASVLDRLVGDLDELVGGAEPVPVELIPADPVAVARMIIDELSAEGVDLSLEIRPLVPWELPDSATLEQTIRRALDAVANAHEPSSIKLIPAPDDRTDTLGIEVCGPRVADIGDLSLLVLRRFVQRRGGVMTAASDSGRGIVSIELPVADGGGAVRPARIAKPRALAGVDRGLQPRSEPAPAPVSPPAPVPAAPPPPPPPPPARGPAGHAEAGPEAVPVEPAAFTRPEPVASEPDVGPAVQSFKVLSVDDNDSSQMLLADHLRGLGHAPFLTDCGSVVPDLITEVEPDIVLLAVELPDIDGPDLCRYVRASGWAGPILGITADPLAASSERCQSSGMDGLLTKPVDLEILGPLLSEAVELCTPTGAHFASPGTPAPVPAFQNAPVGEAPEPAINSDPVAVEVLDPEPPSVLATSGSTSARHALDTLAAELGSRERVLPTVDGFLVDFDDRIERLLSDNLIDAQSTVDGLLAVSAMLSLNELVDQVLLVNTSLAAGISHPDADKVRSVAAVSKASLEAWRAARPVAI
ncbi:MAG: response regulator [Actinomycetia bacterium]|nr:response regulator [Actinomycetes bacterium]